MYLDRQSVSDMAEHYPVAFSAIEVLSEQAPTPRASIFVLQIAFSKTH